MFNLFKYFRHDDAGSSSQLNIADIHKGMVLTHLPTGYRWIVAHTLFGLLLIDEEGHLASPSEKELQDYCNRRHRLRTDFEIECLWQKAVEAHRCDKRLLTRLGLRNSPESIRQFLSA